MKRKTFMLIAAILAFIFGLSMLFAPRQMMQNMATAADPSSYNVLQWAGTMLVAIGLINFLARNDAGSVALRAVMIGNVFLHALGIIVDVRQHLSGFVNASGLATGTVVHVLLIAGFIYYLRKMRTQQAG
jgi:uncharacterized protein YjeT (DUF2065 family)